MAKVSPKELSRFYSILRGVIRPEYIIQAEKKKKKKSGRTKNDADLKKKSGGKVSKKVSRKK